MVIEVHEVPTSTLLHQTETSDRQRLLVRHAERLLSRPLCMFKLVHALCAVLKSAGVQGLLDSPVHFSPVAGLSGLQAHVNADAEAVACAADGKWTTHSSTSVRVAKWPSW